MQQGCHQYTSSARGWNEGRDRSRARARRISIRGSGGAPAESAGDTAPRLDLGVLRRQLRMALPFKQFTEVPLRLGQLDSQVPTSSEIFQETRGRWASSPRRLRHDGVGARGRCEKSVTCRDRGCWSVVLPHPALMHRALQPLPSPSPSGSAHSPFSPPRQCSTTATHSAFVLEPHDPRNFPFQKPGVSFTLPCWRRDGSIQLYLGSHRECF